MTGNYFGSSNYSIDLDTGYLVGVAVGSTLWSDNVRGEIEFSYTNQDVSKVKNDTNNGDSFDANGDVSQYFLLANLWYDWHTDMGLTPYFGGGLGVGWIDPNIKEVDGDDDFFDFSEGQAALAGQLGVGVKWGITDDLALDVGYRFKAIINSDLSMHGDDDDDNLVGTDSYTHTIQVGLTLGL
jgi:opacity protein-like surface antigen